MIKTFDIVNTVVRSKADDLAETHKINEENLVILMEYCGIIDNIVEECFGDQITADIVTDSNWVFIEIVLASFVYESKFKPRAYLSLIERSISIDFDSVSPDKISMKFIFPTVFDKI